MGSLSEPLNGPRDKLESEIRNLLAKVCRVSGEVLAAAAAALSERELFRPRVVPAVSLDDEVSGATPTCRPHRDRA